MFIPALMGIALTTAVVEHQQSDLLNNLNDDFAASATYCDAGCQGDLLELSNAIIDSLNCYRKRDDEDDTWDISPPSVSDTNLAGTSYSVGPTTDHLLSAYYQQIEENNPVIQIG